jgi:hypothetical protein
MSMRLVQHEPERAAEQDGGMTVRWKPNSFTWPRIYGHKQANTQS